MCTSNATHLSVLSLLVVCVCFLSLPVSVLSNVETHAADAQLSNTILTPDSSTSTGSSSSLLGMLSFGFLFMIVVRVGAVLLLSYVLFCVLRNIILVPL
jgi:hypothetical protein